MWVVTRATGHWALFMLFVAPSILASPLPMTDYSQLNHDEPTHWTKPATTPTEQQVPKLEPGTTERAEGDDATTSVVPSTLQALGNPDKNISKDTVTLDTGTAENGSTVGEDLVAVGAVESLDKETAMVVGGGDPMGDDGFLPLSRDDSGSSNTPNFNENGDFMKDKAVVIVEAPTASIGTIKTEVGRNAMGLVARDRLPPAFGTPRLEATDNLIVQDPIDKLARNRDELGETLGVPDFEERSSYNQQETYVQPDVKETEVAITEGKSPEQDLEQLTTNKYEKPENTPQPNIIETDSIDKPNKDIVRSIRKRNGTVEFESDNDPNSEEQTTHLEPDTPNIVKMSSQLSTTSNITDFFKDQNTDFTSEIASIEAKDDNLINNIVPIEREESNGRENESTTKGSSDDSNNTEQFFRYDIIEDIRNLFSNDNDMSENEVKENQLEDVLGFKGEEKVPTEDTLIVQRIEEGGFEGGYQEDDQNNKEEKKVADSLVVPTMGEKESNYETPFSEWDRESEEQEHNMENIVFQMGNESEMAAMDLTNKGNLQGGSWFLLLLSGNSTIVQKRQKDFAKYLKLNLAARLSLEYDELRVNKVVLAPPRLMVNVSVIPSENDNFDEEFDLNERLFGEEEAPLHKLAETNATLLELSGEEYHVVRFLSLRSAQPMTMEEGAVEESRQISDKHGDIEYLIYIIVGGPCLTLIVFLVYTLYRLYLLPKNDWPWQRDKPIFSTGPRHQRMNDSNPFAKPLTVIYSGSFVDRNGPPSGSWLDENYRPELTEKVEPSIENPTYGLGSLSKNALSEICEPSVLDSPRFNVRMMGCQPAHLLLPRTPVKKITDLRPSRGLPKGLDNPNYLT